MTQVTMWTDVTTTAIQNAWAKVVAFLPNVIGALLIIIVGLVVAAALKRLIVELFKVLKIEDFSEKIGFAGILRQAGLETTLTAMVATFVKWVVIIVFLLPAAEVLNLNQISKLFYDVLGYIPNVIVAVAILFFGTLLADFVASLVRGSASLAKSKSAKLLAGVAKYAIVVFSLLMALGQLKIATEFLQILMWGVVGFFVISGAIAFGLGAKGVAEKIIEEFYNKYLK